MVFFLASRAFSASFCHIFLIFLRMAWNNLLWGTRVTTQVPTAVTVLDTANFDAVVMDETKDVLVEFYAVRLCARVSIRAAEMPLLYSPKVMFSMR